MPLRGYLRTTCGKPIMLGEVIAIAKRTSGLVLGGPLEDWVLPLMSQILSAAPPNIFLRSIKNILRP
jgi:hypothetical protein